MSITTALRARRELLRDREAGFTLIELLVVVIIIGILAAIAIPVYLGVQNSARDAATVSNLGNDKIAVNAAASANNGTWVPISTTASVNSANTPTAGVGGFGSLGWTSTGAVDNTKSGVTQSSTAWCITETSASGAVFYVTAVDAPSKNKNATLCT